MEFTSSQSTPDVASPALAPQTVDRSLGEVFDKILKQMQNDELSSISSEDNCTKLNQFVEDCDFCMERLHIEGLISKNEDLDDIQTTTLPVSQNLCNLII